MFPYAMLCTTLIFYSNDWPKRFALTNRILNEKQDENGKFYISKLSDHCIYDKLNDEDTNQKNENKEKSKVVKTINIFSNFIKIFKLF